MTVADYELCKKCEAAMEAAGVFGLTTEEMFEQKAEFAFDLTYALLEEGHYLVRASELEKQFPKVIGVVQTKDSCDENPRYEIAAIDPETETVLSYVTLTNQDILAQDWTIAKIRKQAE